MLHSRSVYPRLKLLLDDGTIKYTTIITKRKISGILTYLKNNNVQISGVATITYKPGFWNAFNFTNEKEFVDGMLPCIEKELVNAFS